MFPGPRISVLGVSVFCKGCDLKLFKEPSTFWRSTFELSIANCFFLETIMRYLFASLELSFNLLHLWIWMKH